MKSNTNCDPMDPNYYDPIDDIEWRALSMVEVQRDFPEEHGEPWSPHEIVFDCCGMVDQVLKVFARFEAGYMYCSVPHCGYCGKEIEIDEKLRKEILDVEMESDKYP